MSWYWLWTLVVGIVITCGGAVASRLAGGGNARLPRPPASLLVLGILLSVFAFLLCVPSRFPFANGTEMGFGVLLGLGTALLAFIVFSLAVPRSDSQASLAATSAGLGGLAVVWVAAVELLFRSAPSYALFGGLAGILLCLLPVLWAGRQDDAGATTLETFALSALLLGLSALIGEARYTVAALRPYWVLPALVFAGGLLGAAIGGLLLGRTRAAAWGSAVFAVIGGVALWLAARMLFHEHNYLEIDPRSVRLLALGWTAFGLAEGAAASASNRIAVRFALPLLGVAVVIIGFNLGGAYAVAIALAAGLPLALPLSHARGGPSGDAAMRWMLGFGLFFLAYRLFLAKFADELRGEHLLEFGRHYVLVGIAVAALWGMALRELSAGRAATVLQWAALALLPPLLFVVFGYEALLGLLLGFLLVHLIHLTIGGVEVKPILFPLAAAWAVIVPSWAYFLTELPRGTRGIIIGTAAALLILGLALLRAPGRTAGGAPAAGRPVRQSPSSCEASAKQDGEGG